MISFFNRLFYYVVWLYEYLFFNKRIPLTSSIILTDKCNLNCKHCVVANLGYRDLSFSEVCRGVESLYQRGSRMLIITGGEPFVWKEKSFSLENVVQYAHQLGFFRIVICTNGTYELKSTADYLWVSLDGFPENHADIRGNIYERVISNIQNSHHKGIYINFTISKVNHSDFEKSASEILRMKNVKGILFLLYTPYVNGDQKLCLSSEEKESVLKRLLKFKRKHPIKVSNTFAGIFALQKGNWERQIWSSITLNQNEITSCCCRRGIYDKNVCKECGCTPAIETWVLQKLQPTAILENLKYL